MKDCEKCCGNCRYHVQGEMPDEEDWVCDNGESEAYGLSTCFDDVCDECEESEE